MTSPNDPSFGSSSHRPTSFDEWLQAAKEQATFFTGLKLDVGLPRWQLADVLPVLPFIGAGIGLAAGLVFAIVRGIAGPGWLAAVLAVGAAVLITRALHEDGLADTADGLGCYGPPSRVAEVTRSGTVGPFGVATLVLVLAVQATGFGSLFVESRWYEAAFAVALGRFSAVVAARRQLPPAHPDGFGALVAGTQRLSIPIWGAVLLGAAALAGFGSSTTDFDVRACVGAMLTVVVVGVFADVFSRHCARRMGGISGDVLGATIELGVAISVVGLLL